MEIAYQIPRASLTWVLLSVVLALAPQTTRLPLWVSGIAAICILWRVLIFLGKLDYPNKSMRIFVFLFILLVTLSQLQTLDVGLDTAATLLALGFVFKLIEMQNKRDIYVVLSLCFVMAMVSFIYSQSVLTTIYFTVVVMVTIGTMASLNRSQSSYTTTSTLRLAVRITAQSLPIMIVLFLAFPRIGPLWAVPTQERGGTVGVSDEMSPGDISRLGRSADLAFRVTFENSPPPRHENMYWRGLVLDYFDGVTWSHQGSSALSVATARSGRESEYQDRIVTSGNPLEYSIILEPTQQPWLYGLHLAEPVSQNVSRARNYEIVNNAIIANRLSYRLRSFRNYQTDLLLPVSVRNRALALPDSGNEQSRELAVALRAGVVTDRDYAFTVLSLFQQQEFYYTLSPSLLGPDRIDDFLFNTREGFCEHYASAFTFMMRAAGVPARVVVGYQGAEYNRFEDYLMVYQYNAHAWTEVWFEGEGWVRFDPTAIVSPDRINIGVEAALQDDPEFMNDSRLSLARFRGANWMNSLRLRLDAVEYEWSRRVVSYDQDLQFEMFDALFGEVTGRKVLTMLFAAIAIVLLLVALTIIRIRPDNRKTPAVKLYMDCCAELARIGITRHAGEGPIDYLSRVEKLYPDIGPDFRRVTQMYMQLNYGPVDLNKEQFKGYYRGFKKELLRFRLKLAAVKKGAVSSVG